MSESTQRESYVIPHKREKGYAVTIEYSNHNSTYWYYAYEKKGVKKYRMACRNCYKVNANHKNNKFFHKSTSNGLKLDAKKNGVSNSNLNKDFYEKEHNHFNDDNSSSVSSVPESLPNSSRDSMTTPELSTSEIQSNQYDIESKESLEIDGRSEDEISQKRIQIINVRNKNNHSGQFLVKEVSWNKIKPNNNNDDNDNEVSSNSSIPESQRSFVDRRSGKK